MTKKVLFEYFNSKIWCGSWHARNEGTFIILTCCN